MPSSHSHDPVPAIVTFTALGDAALDHLVCSLTAACDGSPASIVDVLTRVWDADIEDLVDALNKTDPRRHSR